MTRPQADRPLRRDGARFLIVGAINTLATYALYCVLVAFMPAQAAYAIVFVLGIGIAYIGNSCFVFRSPMRSGTAALYPLVYLLQYGANALVIELLTRTGVGPRSALAISIIIVTPLSFMANRLVLGRRGGPE